MKTLALAALLTASALVTPAAAVQTVEGAPAPTYEVVGEETAGLFDWLTSARPGGKYPSTGGDRPGDNRDDDDDEDDRGSRDDDDERDGDREDDDRDDDDDDDRDDGDDD